MAFQVFSLYKLLLCNYLHKYYCINVKKVVYCLQANKQATAGKLKHSASENESTSTAGTLKAETTNKTKKERLKRWIL